MFKSGFSTDRYHRQRKLERFSFHQWEVQSQTCLFEFRCQLSSKSAHLCLCQSPERTQTKRAIRAEASQLFHNTSNFSSFFSSGFSPTLLWKWKIKYLRRSICSTRRSQGNCEQAAQNELRVSTSYKSVEMSRKWEKSGHEKMTNTRYPHNMIACQGSCFEKGCPRKPYAILPKSIMGKEVHDPWLRL